MRYEDVSAPLGDDPRDSSLYRWEAHLTVDPPTRADTDADERELRFARYDDGRGL
jgi:hypothetical protein